MFLEVINRILLVVFLLSCLTTIRHSYFLLQAIIKSEPEEPIKYKLSKTSLLLLGLSLSYVLSTLFTGISLG